MTTILAQVTAVVLAAVVTGATFAGANGMAAHEHARAVAMIESQVPMFAGQAVAIDGTRTA